MEILKTPVTFNFCGTELKFVIDPTGHRLIDSAKLWSDLGIWQRPGPDCTEYLYEEDRDGVPSWSLSRFSNRDELKKRYEQLSTIALMKDNKGFIQLGFLLDHYPQLLAKLDKDLQCQ